VFQPLKPQATTVRTSQPHQRKIGIVSGRKKKDEAQFLTGWKEIANYLGRGVRTVQRYERYMGFPVRRPAGKQGAAVMATKAELDAWVAASPIRGEFQLARHKAVLPNSPSIADAIREMHRLTAQTQGLRDELKMGVQAIARTVQLLEEELKNKKFDSTLQMNIQEGAGRFDGLIPPGLRSYLAQKAS
jgi:hypothetical protein